MRNFLLGLLLNLAYAAAATTAAPLLLWRSWTTGRYRRGWGAKLLGRVDFERNEEPEVVWLHAVSVGEVNLLGAVIQRLEQQRPGCTCVISTTTDTGYQVARQKYGPRPVFYCPLDFTWAVRRAMRRVRPDLFVLAELELWPNLIVAAKRQGAAVAIVNARLSERSARGYARIGRLMRWLFQHVDVVAAQTERYAARFATLGAAAERVRVSGSVKFDGACADRDNAATKALTQWAGYRGHHMLWLAGSTQDPEEQLAIDAYQQLKTRHPNLRLALAPRHPERRDAVIQMLRAAGLPFVQRSDPDSLPGAVGDRVLLIDVVGELQDWWGRADVAYVGGSMGSRGGQNMIEPAAYGCPLSFGPNTRNFRDVVGMLDACDGAVVVANGEQLRDFIERRLRQPQWAEAMGERARRLVLSQQGAADRTCDALIGLLSREPRQRRRAA